MNHKLLDDQGSMPEMYTKQEFMSRVQLFHGLGDGALGWKEKWLAGVTKHHDGLHDLVSYSYYGIPVCSGHSYDRELELI